MRTIIQILIICGLTISMAYSQQKTGTVQSNMAELSAQQEKPVAVAPAPAEIAVEPVAEKPTEIVDVPAVMEKSREQFVAGDRDSAEAGFNTVLAADPKNKTVALYLQQIVKTRHLKTEESAVATVEASWGDMEMRYYPLEGKVLENMGLATVQEAAHIENKFPFVTFPEGSSAIYRPGLKKLFVRNTTANLQMVESILANLRLAEQQASAEQVEIETRFVEFNEGALEELGFNWSDATAGSIYKLAGNNWKIGDANNLTDKQNLFSDSLRSVPFDQTGALGQGEIRANGEWRANRIEDMFNAQAGTLGLKGQIAGNPVELLIRALDQTAGVDVLSAPSIVTLSGQSATITVGERHFYPDTYEAGVAVGAVVHVKYVDFKEKILGVEMQVTPNIKGEDIQMKINPKITELLGWQQFEISPADTSYTYYQYRIGQQFEHEAVVAQLPLFNRRELKTEISVASGSTIGMGGLVGEKKEAFKDQVPVLGSIPLIGRLFRSEGERSVKRNLMIFVTATKVAPSGRMITERSYEK